jgi:hypothetical protein
MSFLDRIRLQRPTYATKIIVPEEIKAFDPITPLPEPPTPLVVQVQTCGYCGGPCESEPHQFTNGDLYLKRLPFSFLCNSCWKMREDLRTRHNVANTNTLVVGKPQRMRKVEARAEAEQA